MTEVIITDKGGHSVRSVEVADGYRLGTNGFGPHYIMEAFRGMKNLRCRDSDVMLCTFPKTGTHWVFEVIMMLLRGKAESVLEHKTATMLEITPPDVLEVTESPRVLNSHCRLSFLPRELTQKKIKTVLVLRNPKDVAVSYYNFMTGLKIFDYAGKWEDWFQCYVNGQWDYGLYEDYLLEWEKAIDGGHIGFPLHILYYEDLKENGEHEVRRLAKFLDLNLSDDVISAIQRLCNIKIMRGKMNDDIKSNMFNENFEFFRKGEVGDWRNWFTLEQNAVFDSLWGRRMKGSKFTFRYTPNTRVDAKL